MRELVPQHRLSTDFVLKTTKYHLSHMLKGLNMLYGSIVFKYMKCEYDFFHQFLGAYISGTKKYRKHRSATSAARPTSPYSTDSNFSAVVHKPYPKSERKKQLQEQGLSCCRPLFLFILFIPPRNIAFFTFCLQLFWSFERLLKTSESTISWACHIVAKVLFCDAAF